MGEFGGPGDQWSPESLLVGAIASCFALTFRFAARAAGLQWVRLDCHVDATLDRKERALQFTKAVVSARLVVPAGTDAELCEQVLERAEHECLISNSLRCERELLFEIVELHLEAAQGSG